MARSVLIVEDDADVRGALAAFLEGEGHRVVEAADGAAALGVLRGEDVCLVLLDLWMPGMNGWQFRAAQLEDPDVAHVPVVVVTADQAAAGRRDLGAAGYLTKPIELDDLLGYVARFCC